MACVSFHFSRFFIFGQVKGDAWDGRSQHQPTKVFEFCKVILATLKVAINRIFTFSAGKLCFWLDGKKIHVSYWKGVLPQAELELVCV